MYHHRHPKQEKTPLSLSLKVGAYTIGLRRGPQLLQRLTLLRGSEEDLLLVHVIDAAPRQGWEPG
jgi:hypothetical protein